MSLQQCSPISAGISKRLFSPALKCCRLTNRLRERVKKKTISHDYDHSEVTGNLPKTSGQISDAIGLDVEFLEVTEVADLCGQILQLVALKVKYPQVPQGRDAFRQTLQHREKINKGQVCCSRQLLLLTGLLLFVDSL